LFCLIPIEIYQWFDLTLKALIAVAASVIAFNQYKVAKDKLRYDLFEKRFALYNFFHDKWQAIIYDEKKADENETESDKQERMRVLRSTRFIFGNEVYLYLSSFNAKILNYIHAQVSFDSVNRLFLESGIDKSNRMELYDDANKQRQDLIREIEILIQKMEPYLSLTHKV
jgi:hypothetical protein